jgi:dTMP kinase
MFVTFEGIDGCGKTTQATLLLNWLKENEIDCLLTKEPGSIFSKECQQIRKLLLDPENKIEPKAELLLYLADRVQHVEQCIKPALKIGKWVVSDRFSMSTKVYQGCGRGLTEKLDELLEYAVGGIKPDLTLILDLPVELSLKRAKKNNQEFIGGDRMELEAIDLHNRLRAGFQNAAGFNAKLLDANKSEIELHEDIKEIVGRYL